MSASREKKRRQEQLATGSVNPRAAREAEQRAAEKRSSVLYTILAVAFIAAAIFLVVYNSGILERNKTAVTIDGEKYNAAQAAYYYQQAYQSYMNSTSGYMAQMYGMLDPQSPLKDQAYDDTRSWADYFKELAVDNMKFVHAAKKLAQENNITLEQEDQDLYSENMKALKKSAAEAGFTYKAYLKAIYGATMTSSIYEACEKDRMLATRVSSVQQDTFTFTDDEIQTYYEENKNNYDLVDGAYVSVSGNPEQKTDDEGNAIEATEEEKTAAMEAAKETAEEILAAYKAGGDLEELAVEHDAGYYGSEEMSYSTSTAVEWLFDSARKSGDVEVLESEGQYYVALFNGRERNEALNYNIRHILVTEANLELPEGEEAAEGQVAQKAQEILDSWDGSEEGFAKLAGQYSQDSGSKDNGGLIENVAKGDMVSEFNDWCYEAGRKTGDTGIVESSYGSHIMYFTGYTDTEYWHYACENALKSDAFSTWYDETTESVTAEVDESGMDAINA